MVALSSGRTPKRLPKKDERKSDRVSMRIEPSIKKAFEDALPDYVQASSALRELMLRYINGDFEI